MCLKKKKKQEEKPGFLPPYVPCSNPPPSCPHFSPCPALIFSRCASVHRTSGRDYWEWTLQLCVSDVCASASVSVSDRRDFKNRPSCPLLCASMWELLSPSSWTLTFDQALIQSLVVVVEKGRLRGDLREKPHCLPTVNVLFMDLCTFGCDDFST